MARRILTNGAVLAVGAALILAGCTVANQVDPPAAAPRVSRTAPAPVTVPVVRVTDGDTIHVTMPDGTPEGVRFIGVQAPEVTKQYTNNPQCKGPEATQLVTEMIAGQPVTLTVDPTQQNRDVYGRLIRYVDLADGTDLDRALITEGLAREVQYGAKYQRQALYIQAEQFARTEGRGGWAPTDRGGCGWT